MLKYLFDSDVFIRSHQTTYCFAFCPGFWEWLILANRRGVLGSITYAKDELLEREDDLSEWAKNRAATFFREFDETAAKQLPTVSTWAKSEKRLRESARSDFFGCADYYLVTYALAHKCIMVSYEVPWPNSETKIKIPDACKALGIQMASLDQVLRTEKPEFILKK